MSLANNIRSKAATPCTSLVEVDCRAGFQTQIQYALTLPDAWLMFAIPSFGFTSFFITDSVVLNKYISDFVRSYVTPSWTKQSIVITSNTAFSAALISIAFF